MRQMTTILTLILFGGTAGLLGGAELVYRETFSEGKSLNDVGWGILVDAGARNASSASAINLSDGDRRQLPPVHSGTEAQANHELNHGRGVVYLKEGGDLAPFLIYTRELPPLRQPLAAVRWCQALHHSDARMHVAVQVDGNGNREADAQDPWFIARDGIADVDSQAKGLREVAVEVAGITWLRADIVPGGGRGTGSVPTSLDGAQPVEALPPGALVSIGLWSPARYGKPNIDTVEVFAAGIEAAPAAR